jgi:hypothetical protein
MFSGHSLAEHEMKGPYRNLNDAMRHAYGDGRMEGLMPGDSEIWYRKHDLPGEFTVAGIDPENLERTHRLLGSISCCDLERIFYLMQGEIWSPKGEARELIQSKGLHHTSMSVGDVVRFADGSVFACDMQGWKKLK